MAGLYWGLLGIGTSVAAGAITGGGGYWTLSYDGIGALGWQLMNLFSSGLWGPVILFWLIRFLVDDNDNVNWLYVLFSNLTMVGPILAYWISVVLIPIGWVVDGLDLVTASTVLKWTAWVFTAFVVSFYQVAWIDEVRAVYSGDRGTFGDMIDDLDDSVEDTVQENEDEF